MQRWSVNGADRGALPWGGGHLLLFADLGVPSQECGAPGFPGRCGGWGADPGGVTVLGAAQLGDDGRFGGDRCRGGVCGGDGAAAARPDAGSLTEHIPGGCGVFAAVGNVLVRRCGGCAAAAGFPGGVVADGGERVAELLRCRVVTAPPRAGRAVTAGFSSGFSSAGSPGVFPAVPHRPGRCHLDNAAEQAVPRRLAPWWDDRSCSRPARAPTGRARYLPLRFALRPRADIHPDQHCMKARLRWMLGTRQRKITALLVVAALIAAVVWIAWPAPAPVAIASRDVQISAPGGPGVTDPVVLDATVYLPASTPAPAVIIAHGFGGSKKSVAADAEQMARDGFVALAYSARGFGASTGQIALDSLDYEVPDARAVVDWLAQQPEVQLCLLYT